MQRRRFLSVTAASGLLAGCNILSPSDDYLLGKAGPPSGEDLESARRPAAKEPPDATDDTVEPKEYPTKPTSFNDETIEAFVESHERAYRHNAILDRWGSDVVTIGFRVFWATTLASKEEAGVGKCEYKYNFTEKEGDQYVVTDSATMEVTYYVDGSMIVRAEDTGHGQRREELDPDPWDSGVILKPAE